MPADSTWYIMPAGMPTTDEDREIRFESYLSRDSWGVGSVKVFGPGLLSGSDYCDSTLIHVSNYALFLEEHGSKPGVFTWHGGYSSFGILLTDEAMADEDIKATLEALERYPVLDDEDVSWREIEAADEAWDSWARRDFLDILPKLGMDEAAADELGNMEPAQLRELFETARESANVYWENESAGSMYIDTERVGNAYLDSLPVIE